MSKKHSGMLIMVLCTLFWSIGGLFIKLVPWNGMVVSGFRSLIAAVFFAGYLRVRRIPVRLNRRSLLVSVMLASTCMAFVCANKLTSSINAIVLQQCSPVIVLLYSVLIQKKRMLAADYLVVALTAAGILVCFAGRMGSGSLAGDFLAIVAGVFFAGNMIVSAEADSEERFSGLFFGHILCAAAGLAFVFRYPAVPTPASVASILVLGIFQIAVPYILYAFAIERAGAFTCSLLAVLEPVFNPIWVYLFLGESPGAYSVIGGILVIGSIALWCIYREKRERRELAASGNPDPAGEEPCTGEETVRER